LLNINLALPISSYSKRKNDPLSRGFPFKVPY